MSSEPHLEGIVPAATLSAWQTLARELPHGLYLTGATALAVRLRHRESADLRFLYHGHAVDLSQLAHDLEAPGRLSRTETAPGLLRGRFGETETEFRHADENAPQTLLEMPTLIAGLRVAALEDLMALKLSSIATRRKLSDYFDLMSIEQSGGLSLESGIRLFLERFRIALGSDTLMRLVNALGYLDDVPPDDTLPVGKQTLASWWARRQARLVRELAHTQ